MADSEWKYETKLVRAANRRSSFGETSEALFLNSGFVFESAAQAEAAFKGENDRYIYSRYTNPTVQMFEERLAELEGAEACKATSSGMAAVFGSLMCFLKTGDRVVASRELFGNCIKVITQILPRFGIKSRLVSGTDLGEWREALSTPAQAVFLESPSNPMLDVVDIREVSMLAHDAGAKVIVDNVFATPLYQRPLNLGADIVTYSTTKHIDGQGRCLGGAILSSKAFINEHFMPFLRSTGPSLSPFNAWVMLKSLDTLELRVSKASSNALSLAKYLQVHPQVKLVRYPGLPNHPQYELVEKQMLGYSTLVTFALDNKDEAFKFMDALKLFTISNNLGDSKSLVCHPATTTHSRNTEEERRKMGITPGIVRLSVGLENVEDLIQDVEQALLAAY